MDMYLDSNRMLDMRMVREGGSRESVRGRAIDERYARYATKRMPRISIRGGEDGASDAEIKYEVT